MCGIAGAFGFSPEVAKSLVHRMLGRVSHRGLLDCWNEVEVFDWGAAGTNRLPIESDANRSQPRFASSGDCICVYNGEVYNWREIARQQDLPPALESMDETQVVVEVAAQGSPTLHRTLDGMFAIIVARLREREVCLIRDGFGIKPLYFAFFDGGMVAASELKALSAEAAIDDIFELEPGTMLTWSTDTATRSASKAAGWDVKPERFNAEKLAAALRSSIECCARTTSQAGVLLSGGVDSGLVYFLARNANPDIVAITAGQRHSSDVAAARRLVKSAPAKLIEVPVPEEELLFERLETTIRTTESFEPNVVRQSAAASVMMEAARQRGFRVLLCGEGADELFGGYPEFLTIEREGKGKLRKRFLFDLYRTQLQRVDRTAMKSTIEVRVPFLLRGVVESAMAIDTRSGLASREDGRSLTKIELRAAARALGLPDFCASRPKVVLSEGMGLGSNDPKKGMFSNLARKSMSIDESQRLMRDNEDWGLRSQEEALYFKIFRQFGYSKLRSAKVRVIANETASRNG